MWHLIGIDDDGARHHFNQCKTEEEAQALLAKAMPAQVKMIAPYVEAIEQARKDEADGKNVGLDYSDYMGWKMQGFYVERFELEYREGDY
jgi:hypothetical protein